MAGDDHRPFGAYDIQREVGRGGMGVVYLATDRRLGRRVALKVIVPELAADAQFRLRFEREARVAATLEHPHVVPVYEAGEQDGSLFIAMRFIDGRDLATEVRDHGALAPDRLARIVLQVAGALDAAHRSGVVHRDVKPANVLLTLSGEDEQAYLTDFGLTREAASESGLTMTGQWVGTVDYAAPEQILGEPTDARSDVYALGCLAFQALTGQPPFRGAPAARLFAHMNEPPPSACAARPGLPPAVDAALARALAKKPEDRFQSAGDLGRALAAALAGEAPIEPEGTVARGPALTGVPPTEPVEVAEPTRQAAAVTRRSPVATAEEPETTLVAPPPPSAPAPARSRQPRVLAAIALVLVVAAAAVVTVLLGAGSSDKSYADRAKDAVSGLARANRSLSDRFTGLTPSAASASIITATDAATAAARDARQRVGALKAADDPALAGGLTHAIEAEQAFLGQAGAAAAAPSSADTRALQGAAGRMTAALAALSGKVAGLASVEGISRLTGWVQARKAAARRRQGVDAFIQSVDGVLAGARPGRAQISQIHTDIDNGTITPDAARTGIDQVVANRQAALTAARKLSVTQTDAAGPIKNLLVDSFERSLDYDRDLQDGAAAYQSGDFERYIAKVFDDALRSNDAATQAKRAFLGAYNRLRATRGRPAVGDDF